VVKLDYVARPFLEFQSFGGGRTDLAHRICLLRGKGQPLEG